MSGAFGSSQWMYSSGAAEFYPYSIGAALRFNDNDSAYLNRTPSSAGNRKTSTLSVWVKRGNIGSDQVIFTVDAAANDSNRLQFRFGSGNELRLAGQSTTYLATNAKFRDVSSWYHIVLAIDTTQATASDRLSLYVNGEKITSLSASSYPSQNADLPWNLATLHGIGSDAGGVGSGSYFDGYMAEVNFIDGTALDPTSFGETINGIWVPKAYDTADGAYGTNGFYLPFDDSSAIGDDESGNTNDWTANNLAASDVMTGESPTNNFATLNPLDSYPSAHTFSEGNLRCTHNSGTWRNARAGMRLTSGQWYWETVYTSVSGAGGFMYGIGNELLTTDANPNTNYSVNYNGAVSGTIIQDGTTVNTGTSFTAGDVMGLALDIDAGTVKFYKNNTLVYTVSSITGNEFYPIVSASATGATHSVVNFGQDSTFAGNKTAGGNADANGIGDFFYAPPSGLALCSANLPEPTISPNAEAQADDYFNTVLYTGDGTNGQAITGTGHQPDWLWIKSRSGTAFHELHDSVRGAGTRLFSNDTAAESTVGTVSSFDSDGFTVSRNSAYDGTNQNGVSFVGWSWKAGGAAVSNTDGSITSQVSAAPDAGFSIVSYTGTGSSGTYGHGLGVAPNMIITKDRTDPAAWAVYVSDIGTGKYLELDQTDATTTAAAIYPSVSSTTIGVGVQGDGSLTNTSGDNYISYCFHSVDGFSKVGSYVGNGSSDGVFVFTGFEVAFLLTKEVTSTSGWNLRDNKRSPENVVNEALQANTSGAELTSGYDVDFLSNGFKLRTSLSDSNTSGQTYIFYAVAKQPFKYANAR